MALTEGGFGDAEALLGEVLAAEPGLRGRMVLASKGGIMPPLPYDQSAGYLACRQSMPRSSGCKTETIDLYQIHRPDILAHPQEVARTLDDAVKAGKDPHARRFQLHDAPDRGAQPVSREQAGGYAAGNQPAAHHLL
jgi:aryl-alcohol dehydrogenase-like predicted oxidoreductase